MLFWDNTLLKYLELANEDVRVVQFVSERILPKVARLRGSINWLEVGPGPGTKTAALFETLAALLESRLELTKLLEPCPTWITYLRNFQTLLFADSQKRKVVLENTSFEEYETELGLEGETEGSNFITFFHVLYEHKIIESTAKYLQRKAASHSPLIACIVIESTDSDFYRLRRELQALGFEVPVAAAELIPDWFSKLGIPVTINSINDQYCRIIPGCSYRDWLLDFLLGCERRVISELSATARKEADHLLANFIKQRSNKFLYVPDLAITAVFG